MISRRKKSEFFKKLGNEKFTRLTIFVITLFLLLLILPMQKLQLSPTKYGYLGIFIINFFSSATVILPVPGIASVFLGGAIFRPLLVGVVSAIGATFGELFGYLMGFGSIGLLRSLEKSSQFLKRIEFFFQKIAFITIFIFAALPMPLFDFIGILAGSFNYPIWKFASATLMGRVLRNIIIAWTGSRILPI